MNDTLIKSVTDNVKKKFVKCNYGWQNNFIDHAGDTGIEKKKDKYFTICEDCGSESSRPSIHNVEFHEEYPIEYHEAGVDKKVGIVNWIVDAHNLEECLRNRPNRSRSRQNDFFEVLNYAIRNKIEILVFPELSIPVDWFPLLVEKSAKSDFAVIGGLEFYLPGLCYTDDHAKWEGTEVNNYLFSIFPIRQKHYSTAIPLLRRKNYYAPSEIEIIEGHHFMVRDITPSYYRVHWRKTYMAAYNCFELSNISDRSLFKAKVDFISAVEYNSDIPYFSNIAESWARDLHCFILQSNPSQLGDSRIVQPSKTDTKDVLRVSGGMHPLVLTGMLEIKKLREFQRTAYNLQLKDKNHPGFKCTPAQFEHSEVLKRIADKSIVKKDAALEIKEQKEEQNQDDESV